MTSKQTKRNPLKNSDKSTQNNSCLVLHNDDFHSFDYVTNALMEICEHSFEQATQCTLLTHYKGKCNIKKGHLSALRPLRNALLERDLNATID